MSTENAPNINKPTEINLKALELDHNSHLEHLKAVISFSMLALKSSILVNGAASISLLTFIGNGKATEKLLLICSLITFGFGVVLGTGATFLSYLSQNNFLDQLNAGLDISNSKYKNFAILVCGLSYLCFMSGIILAAAGMLSEPTTHHFYP